MMINIQDITEPMADTLLSLFNKMMKGYEKNKWNPIKNVEYSGFKIDNRETDIRIYMSFQKEGEDYQIEIVGQAKNYYDMTGNDPTQVYKYETDQKELKLKTFQVFENVFLDKIKQLKFSVLLGKFVDPKTIEMNEKYKEFIKYEDCAVCFEPTTLTPKSCNHFVCYDCMEKIIKHSQIKCPVCRKKSYSWDCEESESECESD